MISHLRRLRGILVISLIWGAVWAAMFTVFLYVLSLFLPFDGDVGTLKMMRVIGWVGFVSGAIFASLMAVSENRKSPESLSIGRAVLWGALSSAVYPVATGRANQVFWTCVFGVVVAGAMGLARRSYGFTRVLRDVTQP